MGINELIKIGFRMKQLRKKSGISQKEMAGLLELSTSTYSNYENGHREPPLDVIEKFCSILKIDATGLLFDNLYDTLKNQTSELSDLTIRIKIDDDNKYKNLVQYFATLLVEKNFTQEELKDIEKYIEFVASKRNND